MILCASSTSIPSRFKITVELSTNVSAISRVSSIEEGLITQTSIFEPWFDLRLLLIGVILEDAAGRVWRSARSCLTVTFDGAGAVCFGADACFGAVFTDFSSISSKASSSSASFFLENLSKNFFLGFSSKSSSRKSSSSSSSNRSSSKNPSSS